MARSSLKITIDQRTPLTASDLSPRTGRALLRKVVRHLEGILGGVVSASHVQFELDGAQPVAASGTVIAASVAAADTVSVNGQALTGTEKRANCTVTFVSVANNDTITVNGRVFTAKTSGPSGDYQFLVGVNDATDAAAFVTKVNAVSSSATEVYGIIEAVRRAADGVVSIYAIATGTAGNSYTIATSNGTRLAITDDSSGSFTGGAANANNVFDPFGNDTRVATEIARAINDSTTAIVTKHVEASNWAGTLVLSTCTAGTVIGIAGHEFRAIAAANSTPQADYGSFAISGSDSADGDALVTAINSHPVLSHQVVASNSSGTVTVRQRRGTSSLGRITVTGIAGTTPSGVTATQFAAGATVLVSALSEDQTGNGITWASSNGTRLAVSGARLAGGTGSASGTRVRMVIGGSAG